MYKITINSPVGILRIVSDGKSVTELFNTESIEVKENAVLTEAEVNKFCLGLPRYKRPRKIIFAPVPRNPTGKIEKPKLRKMYGASALVAQQNGL